MRRREIKEDVFQPAAAAIFAQFKSTTLTIRSPGFRELTATPKIRWISHDHGEEDGPEEEEEEEVSSTSGSQSSGVLLLIFFPFFFFFLYLVTTAPS